MPVQIWCHNCQRQFSVASNSGECPACGEGFIEEVQAPPGGAAAPASAAPGGGAHAYSRTFNLPGGGTFRIVTSTGGGGGGGGGLFGPGFGGAGGPGMGGGMPLGGDPFVSGVLEAVLGGGFLHPLPGGGFAPGGPFVVPVPDDGGPPGAAEQAWLDRLMSQIMNEYQPASQAASQRAVRSLPTLRVRAASAEGEPGEGQAIARAGEPCSVCHDEFKEGDGVLEMPCQHNYHPDCLLPWLETHNTCPVCRHELPAEDPQVEARRRQRAEGAEEVPGSRRHVRRRQEAAPAAGGSGNRLTDLLSNISARWESLRRDGSGETDGGRASSGMTSAQHAAPQAAAAAAAATAGSSSRQADRAAAVAPGPPAAAGSGMSSASSGGLRQRRDAAAAAAERRLRGEEAAPSAPPLPTAPASAAARPTMPAHPAAAPARPPPRVVQQLEEEEEEAGRDGVFAGAVAGGILGALLGGAMMLLGRRRDRE